MKWNKNPFGWVICFGLEVMINFKGAQKWYRFVVLNAQQFIYISSNEDKIEQKEDDLMLHELINTTLP